MASDATSSSYWFDRGWHREQERLEIQARFLDPGTIRHLQNMALEGARCAEIGAGAGSIAIWLSDRVGDTGTVVATDVDTRFLQPLQRRGLEIRKHDIVAGPLEEGVYDLVHTRLLLMHLPDRARAVEHMVRSLRPGGWLLAEDYDLGTAGFFHPHSDLQEKINDAIQSLFAEGGGDPRYGIKLVAALQSAGLEEVDAEARLQVIGLGTPSAEALALKLEQFRARLLSSGLVTEDEMNRAIDEVRTPRDGAVHYPPLMVTARGRRP